jgi:hypothetical protein
MFRLRKSKSLRLALLLQPDDIFVSGLGELLRLGEALVCLRVTLTCRRKIQISNTRQRWFIYPKDIEGLVTRPRMRELE